MRYGNPLQVTGAFLTAPIQLVGPSPNRVAILFSIDAGTGYLTTAQGSLSGAGFPISPNEMLELSYEKHGEIVRQAWYASADSNARKIGVIPIEEAP